MALRVGLTGGIGSGKTTVAQIFEVLGIPVYYADKEARRIMNEDMVLRQQVIAAFGEKAYLDNKLNRPYVSSVVFSDKNKLAALNAIVHPATIRDGERWMQQQLAAYAVKEAALIFESGVNKYLDYIIGVSAPHELRTKRVMNRESITADEVALRMRNQMDEEKKLALCHAVVINDERQLLIPQVLALHNKLLELALEKGI